MLEKAVAEANETLLGLVLPVDLRQRLQAEGRVDLDGFAAHWAKPSDVNKLVEFFERQLGDLIGAPVHIDHESNLVFPDPESDGRQFMISLSLVVAVIVIGAFLVPYLMLEEKESHTMEALLVSPASHSQMVLGKAIAGLFYCLTAAVVVFAINFSMVTQWGIAFLAIICGSLFSVAIGLMLGTLFENPGSVNLWGGVILIILIAPASFELTAGSGWPPILQTLTPWLPSVALSNAIRTSFSDTAPLNLLVPNLGIMLGVTVLLLILVVWKVRRLEN
ncbi:MAG TPA: ABC transporter permease [Anaerolineae bacterium]|nr:ABC transporter permease [Anaerolineae bacterium]